MINTEDNCRKDTRGVLIDLHSIVNSITFLLKSVHRAISQETTKLTAVDDYKESLKTAVNAGERDLKRYRLKLNKRRKNGKV